MDANRGAGPSRRERLRERQERQRKAEKRARVTKVAGAVAAVLVLAAVVGVLLARDDGGEAAERPVTVGRKSAPATLDVYEDFRCPACAEFEQRYGRTIRELTREGKLRVRYHLVTIIDANMRGKGSHRAANAALCADDEGRFTAYHDMLYRRQPDERDDAFAHTNHLLKLAREAGVEGAGFEKCVRGDRHGARVSESDAAFESSGHRSTPTVLLDGDSVQGEGGSPLTPAQLRKKVESAS